MIISSSESQMLLRQTSVKKLNREEVSLRPGKWCQPVTEPGSALASWAPERDDVCLWLTQPPNVSCWGILSADYLLLHDFGILIF